MPSGILSTCSRTLDLPPSLSPTISFSHPGLQFLEGKKKKKRRVARAQVGDTAPGLMFYPDCQKIV